MGDRKQPDWKHVLRIPDSMRSFGEALRWLREQRGMTLRALAREVGVSPAFQVDVEHDRRTTSRVEDYARVLGIDVRELESRQGFTRDLRDWLSEHPELIDLIRAIRACHCKPLVLKRLCAQVQLETIPSDFIGNMGRRRRG